MKNLLLVVILFLFQNTLSAQEKIFDPSFTLWYKTPAKEWEEALPVGNGRLGAMVFGKYGEEKIQINEETIWSGGPYSTVVKGGAKMLPEIQKDLFEGKPLEAHKLFGRYLMGYPVEQQKYQSAGYLHLFFDNEKEVNGYRRWLDLNTGIAHIEYQVGDIIFKREVFSSAPDEVLVVRLTSTKPKSISFNAELRGIRNQAHSNYATDYFRMDGVGSDGLMINGKSADYMGIAGKLRYRVQLIANQEGGEMSVDGSILTVSKADAVTLYIVAATNFVNYKDVSADQNLRVENYLRKIEGKPFEQIKADAVADCYLTG
jgi:alpha-L-fucosidase 2